MLVSGDDRGNIWLYILDEIAKNPSKHDSSLKPSRVRCNAFNSFDTLPDIVCMFYVTRRFCRGRTANSTSEKVLRR